MNEDVVFELLRRVPLFAETPGPELRAVARSAHQMSKKKSSRIFEEGSAGDSCYVLTSGRAKVVLSGQEGMDVILGFVEPFELVGEIALLDNATRTAALVAVEESHLIQIPKSSFAGLRNNRQFEDRLVMHLTSSLRRTTEQLRAIYTYSSTERVSWCLARLALQAGRRTGSRIVISPRPLHHELAEMTGCSRETVNRILLRLRRAKSVSWSASDLTIEEAAFARYLVPECGDPRVTRFV